jgi:hypothetical protein
LIIEVGRSCLATEVKSSGRWQKKDSRNIRKIKDKDSTQKLYSGDEEHRRKSRTQVFLN